MTAFYNEIDPYAAQWLRNLIAAGHIAPGVVDERNIVDLDPADLAGYAQCHFFAGIGVWSHALRLAGWADSRPVWTGSCPCQPFSVAGKGRGHEDERHLWPAWQRLIRECRPPVVFGEQVAGGDGLAWLDVVLTDLEDDHYAVAAADLCAAGVGAPHIRQRLFFVADAERGAAERQRQSVGATASRDESESRQRERLRPESRHGGIARDLADAAAVGSSAGARLPRMDDGSVKPQRPRDASGAVGHADDARLEGRPSESERSRERAAGSAGVVGGLGDSAISAFGAYDGEPRPGRGQQEPIGRPSVLGFWSDADWLPCRDGKARPVGAQPQPLADGASASLGPLRAADVAALEGAIDAAAVEGTFIGAEAVRDLQRDLAAQAELEWPARGLPPLHAPPFLLALLRQLARQGWRFAECTPLPSEEAARPDLRGMRDAEGAAGASRRHRLAEQLAGERSDAVHILSSLLARAAHKAWGDAYRAHAEIGFPLTHDAPARVGRLRAYGNAIVGPLAAEFIRAGMTA